jgi:adenosylcobinamide-phosphate guanylyltransferase
MRALIMAGGAGSRLGRGEKTHMLVCGSPMLSYIIEAFHGSGCEPVVAVSPKTPMTANWCRAHGLTIVQTAGCGFIEDMVHAVRQLEEKQPIVVSVSDIPCITPAVVTTVLRSYENCGKDALSTWVPADRVKSCRGGMPYHENIGGVNSCPAGINILCGSTIDAVQEEFSLLLDEPRLGLNVNTPEDLARAEAFLLKGTAHRAR